LTEGASSKLKEILAAVPEGSILGPLLFILYVNELAEMEQLQIKMYADDATLFVTYTEPQTAAQHLTDSLTDWAHRWFVKFNPAKSENLTITRKRQQNNPDITMNNVPITNVEEHKHLGLNLQKDGKWASHVAETTARAKRRLDILRGHMYDIDRASLEKLYLTYIRPILEYSDIVWDNCTILEADKIEAIQRAAARIVTGGRKGTSHARLYDDVQWEKLTERRRKHKLTMLYKIVHNLAPNTLSDLLPDLVQDRQNYNLRNGEDLTIIATNTSQHQKSFYPSVIMEWNNLPNKHRNAPSAEAFKEALKSEKLSRPHYYTGERKVQILHTKLRLQCINLNAHLHHSGLKDDPSCECGAQIESNSHYLLESPI
jgi:hypothetical protein